MDLKQLEYFVNVIEFGSFSRAALVLDVAQSALSRQVRLLEVEVRQTLLTRTGRGVMPTEAGTVLLDHARSILHQVDRAREDLGKVRGSLAGHVAIGLPYSVARVLAAPLIREVHRTLPEARLSVSEGMAQSLLEMLLDRRLDIALLYNVGPTPDIDIVPLMEEELFLVRAAGRGGIAAEIATLREVAAQPLVLPTRPHTLRLLVDREMELMGCKPDVALEVDSIAAILDLVADGVGGTLLSRRAVETAARPGAFCLHRIVDPPLYSRLSMATYSLRPSTRTQKAVLEFIFRNAAKLLRPAGDAPAPLLAAVGAR
ncbi:LysR substrate-binding domain-containing protein [Pigmentiphaga soli]|uniref:LysR substrate-binding domain-containing protein n=1 Tax=Pigmentiphaga soli TaxID=1007095 RepID=A0ABP8GZJ8_9BURK